MQQTDKVFCPHFQEEIPVSNCFFCFKKHGFFDNKKTITEDFLNIDSWAETTPI